MTDQQLIETLERAAKAHADNLPLAILLDYAAKRIKELTNE